MVRLYRSLQSAFSKVSAADVADVVNRYLTEEARMTLILAPRDTFLDEFGAVNEIETKATGTAACGADA